MLKHMQWVMVLVSVFAVTSAFAAEDKAVTERIKPVGQVDVASAETAASGAAAASPAKAEPVANKGKEVYEKHCIVCHAQGVAGAPKFGDKDAWKARADKISGNDKVGGLVEVAKKGLNAMPPKGTCEECADADFVAAINYMMSGGKEETSDQKASK